MAVNYELDRELQAELGDGESILWQGQPDPKRATVMALPIILFAIPWTAFAIFWMWGASGFGKVDSSQPFHYIFMLFGLPFVLIGVGMLSSPFWIAKTASQTVYAITNKRAIIIKGLKSRTVNSYYARDIKEITRTERPDGTGDVIFARSLTATSNSGSNSTLIGFTGIPDPRTVEQLLRDNVLKPPKSDSHSFGTSGPA